MPSIPSSGGNKSWWARPENRTTAIFIAIMGVGAAKRLSNVKWAVVRDLALTWVLTFPGCGLIGFLMAKLFINIF
jgi:PiT family inorganic phosphate transporter